MNINWLIYNISRKMLIPPCKRKIKGHNFDTAKNIGIITNIKTNKEREEINKLVQQLEKKNIKIKIIGLIKDEVENKYLSTREENIILLSKKELKLHKLPQVVTNNLSTEFHILLCLYLKANTYLEYLTNNSQANFKIGKNMPNLFLDFSLKLKEDTLKNLIEQIQHYSSKIKSIAL